MLHVQKYLADHTLEDLKNEYGIKVKEYDNFIGLNYDQVKSPKSHPITVECRSLKLHKNNLSVASRSFDRFFNYGEVPEMYKDFNITKSVIMEKVDGSLINIWYNQIDQRWEVSSRSMIFGESKPSDEGKTFREMVISVFSEFDLLDPNFTYIFEYIGPDNTIVTPYPVSQLVLLGIRNNQTGSYQTVKDMETLINLINNQNVRMVKLYDFISFEDIIIATKNFKNMEEGFVIWDTVHDLRIKIKSDQYVAIHRLHGNINSIKDIIEIVVTGETSEILLYLPHLMNDIVIVKSAINQIIGHMELIYLNIRYIEHQKDYAKEVLKHNNIFKGILFNSRKNHTCPVIEYDNLPTKDKVNLIYNYIKN